MTQPNFTESYGLIVLKRATSRELPILREWMHEAEYEGGRDKVMNRETGQTNAQWVDTMPLDDLKGYISDHISGYGLEHCGTMLWEIFESLKVFPWTSADILDNAQHDGVLITLTQAEAIAARAELEAIHAQDDHGLEIITKWIAET